MSGRWDFGDEKTLASELKRNKYFDSENLIERIAKEGIQLNKLPEHFVLDDVARKELIKDIDNMVDNMEGIDSMADVIMGFLKGYAYGMQEAITDKKVIDI